MSDIVERLRSVGNGDTWSSYEVLGMLSQAANEIERLTDELKEVRNWAKGDIARLTAEIERLKATLAASCVEERAMLYEATWGGGCDRAIKAEAEVERLQSYIRVLIDKDKAAAEIERLKAALEAIAQGNWNRSEARSFDVHQFARRALEGKD
jgi:hypothetical protein